ncbi:hypothetical protein KEM44_21120 [Sinorhizobium meliloti]|uniref:hypothetical protein n=1 Tax=Rhizobium meliloti TaxID=382 RepID=UPI000B5A3B33|nr:hypothetical protein [Sinorhizobium meliloti]ASJ58989.1 hypothetical protein SMB554_07160 [Sinorhizobium meliloti]MCK3783482.1 hypothetical protein [Sinorhizobium meliloti]MCK3787888.1 hypothetical protein [Sinorhizobium meliloti]MCK3794835.1 hypothetical protein [Sinorhizobium meliloti]UTG98629.1 hypothetical protein KEM44_21120 [Sinorhizobium meliloti]
MAILQKLADLGFANSAITGEAKGLSTVRVRTGKGWVYHRFASADQVDAWAKFHEPEVQE